MCYENVCATEDMASWILNISTSCKVVTFMSCFLSPWVKTPDACQMGIWWCPENVGHDGNYNHGYPILPYLLYKLTHPKIPLFLSCSKGTTLFQICYAKDLFPNIFTFLVKNISLKQIFLYVNQHLINSNLLMLIKRPLKKAVGISTKKGEDLYCCCWF